MNTLTIPARNGFEAAARFKKTVNILAALQELNGGILSDAELADAIPGLPEPIRRIVAAKAGVRKPSDVVWAACEQFLRMRNDGAAS